MTTFAVALPLLLTLLLLALALVAARNARLAEARHPPHGAFATVAGVRLHHLDLMPSGWNEDDATLVFIHGASGNLRDQQLAFEAALAGRHRLVFVDRPGHGHSERGPADAHHPAVQAELIAGLLDRLGVRRAVAVGHSWGGSVVAQLALQRPETVAGLVFIAPATHPWPGGVNWYYDVAAMPVVGPLFSHTLAPVVAAGVAPRAMGNVFAPEAAPEGYAEATGLDLLLRPATFRANAQDVARLKQAVGRAVADYPSIAQPAVVITGDRDTVVWPEIHSAGLARDLANARLVTLAGAGHMPHHTRKAAVVAEIETLAAEVAGARRARAGAMEKGRP
jgi:pimeloyl-ACP methyl ester carboxylesterase